jgi:hypothetical protein
MYQISGRHVPMLQAGTTAEALSAQRKGPLTWCYWWRGQDLNLRPSGYEPDELPDCSTPRWRFTNIRAGMGIGNPRASRHAVAARVSG